MNEEGLTISGRGVDRSTAPSPVARMLISVSHISSRQTILILIGDTDLAGHEAARIIMERKKNEGERQRKERSWVQERHGTV